MWLKGRPSSVNTGDLMRDLAAIIFSLAVCSMGLTRVAEAEVSAGSRGIATSFFAEHCVECHGEKKQKGKIALHDLDPTKLGTDDVVLWGKILEVLKFGEMPPEDEPRPDAEAVEEATDWIQRELVAAGRESDIEHKLKQPGYANLLNHEKLFDGSEQGPAFSPPRMWRLHPEAYLSFLETFGKELGKGGALSKPFVVGDGKGLPSNYASIYRADSAALGQLMLNCRQIAQLQTVGFRRMQTDNRTKEQVERHYVRAPESFTVILGKEGAPTEVELAAAVAEEFRQVLRRVPTAEEAGAYVELLKGAIEIGGAARGLRTMAMAVLLRPDAIYRLEVGLGEVDEAGRRMLSPYELAHALSYALTDLPPEKVLLGPMKNKRPQPPSLLDLADEGALETREDVGRMVARMWESDTLDKPRILRFFQEFFGYHAAGSVFKGDRAPRGFSTRHLVKDADQLVLHIVDEDRDVLRELLTTDRYFFEWPGSLEEYERKIKYITGRLKENKGDVNYRYFIERAKRGLRPIAQANPEWRKLVRYYNLNEETWDYPLEQPFPMPEGQRVGLLTHPAWLVAWSGNSGNDPIRRGKWIYEHLLAGSVPEVPITVDAQVPEDPHKTLRQRLEATREEYCWKCHGKMNPFGLPFEAYDDFGMYREEEGLGHTKGLGKAKDTAPVDSSGEITGSGDGAIDGEVRDAIEMMHRLAESERVRQSFVRHAFRYWMGRNEMMSDSPTLMAADGAYVEGGGSFKALVMSLLTSDSFLYRR
jgi:hypothetical protein